jgi:hypothetical protein
VIAPSYNSNQSSYQIDGFIDVFKRWSHGSAAFSSRTNPNACEAKAMTAELVSSLRVLDKSIKETIDLAAADMATSKKRSPRKQTTHYKRIKELMLSQLGASELGNSAQASCTVFFIEPSNEVDNALYLCRSICSKSDPLNTWTSERLFALSSHALSRAFMRRCAWASGYAVTVDSLVEELCSLYGAYDQYVSRTIPFSGKASAFQRLLRLDWLLQCGVNGSQYIVDLQDLSIPCIKTVVSSRVDSLNDGELRMIPPKGRFGLPRLAMNAKGLQTP